MIRKYHRRMICLFMAFLILIALLPAAVFAEENGGEEPTAREVKAELSHMYREILGIAQSETLDGLCATLVTWELYIKGINRQFVSGDGKDQYDNYCDMDVTSGGYYVHALSAEDYTLEEALLKITNNGTRNVYNILIGFEKTRSAAGRLFGHTVFIGGIIDGTVYYVESNDYSVGGVFYKEGTPIGCSIEEFAAEYAEWATYEGLIAFSENCYLEECQVQSTDVYVRTQTQTEMRTEPCGEEDSPWSSRVRRIQEGEIFRADGLVRNTEGEYWYRVAGERDLYFPAEQTDVLYNVYTDVTVSGLKTPEIITSGDTFEVEGTLTSTGGDLRVIRCQIFSGHAGEGSLLCKAVDFTDVDEYDLKELGKRLNFRDLAPGVYHYEISAVVENSFIAKGEPDSASRLIKLWTGEFAVCGDEAEASAYRILAVDACGGNCAVDQVVLDGDGGIPEAIPQRKGYRFSGWLREEGSLRAYWKNKTGHLQGWHQVDGVWRYYDNGEYVTGFVTWEDLTFCIREDGSFHTGWLEENGKTYYFYENGIAAEGRTIIDGVEYLFEDHSAAQAQRLEY